MAEIFLTEDYQGRQVVLYADTWKIHIIEGHPEMEDFLEQILLTIETPTLVVESGTRSDTEIMLRYGDYNNEELKRKYLRTYVRYGNKYEQSTAGVVTTAYFSRDLPNYKNLLYFQKTETLK